MLTLTSISKSFGTRPILKNLSLTLPRGESLAVLGPSGSGKTTLLNIVAGLLPPDGGSVSVGDVNPYMLSDTERADFRRAKIGLVFQQHRLLPQLSALENVALPMMAGRRSVSTDDMNRARMLLGDVGLSDRATQRPHELSGGECQRVALARALVRRPALLIADEPTASLDHATAADIGKLLIAVATSTQTTLLAASHDTALAALFGRQLAL